MRVPNSLPSLISAVSLLLSAAGLDAETPAIVRLRPECGAESIGPETAVSAVQTT